MRVSFIIKKPGNGRRSWGLLKVTRTPAGRASEAFKCPEIDAIASAYALGTLDFTQAHQQTKDLQDKLYKAENGVTGVKFNSHNLEILGEFKNPVKGSYWCDVYGRRKHIIDRRSSYYFLVRAIKAIGSLSLITATETQLQDAVDAKFHGKDDAQRRIVSSLQSILNFLGRKAVRLQKARREFRDIVYATESEFLALAGFLEPKVRCAAGIAFYGGLRLGEIFAVSEETVRDHHVQVDHQVDKLGVKRHTKGRNRRRSAIIPNGREYFDAWLAIPEADKRAMRLLPFHDYIRLACAKAGLSKSLKFHDLRHSYAIHLLSKQVPLSFVAQNLGNSHKVCEDHYTGRVVTDGVMDAVQSILKKNA